MRVVVPYSGEWPSPETCEALRPYDRTASLGSHVEYRYVGGDDEAYWRLLSELWRAGEDFAIVEQDIVITPDTLASFDACPKVWCASPYPYLRSERYAGLGCVRFRGSLLRAMPDLMDAVAKYSDSKHPHRHWCALDAWTQRSLRARRVQTCVQHPAAKHLHLVPSHGCVPAEFLPAVAA